MPKPLIWILAGLALFAASMPVGLVAGHTAGFVAIVVAEGCFMAGAWPLFRPTGPVGRAAFCVAGGLVMASLALTLTGARGAYARLTGWLLLAAFASAAVAVVVLGAEIKRRSRAK